MDWKKYAEATQDEWDARKANPVTIKVSAEEFRDASAGLMLLRRVQGNTKDGDLLRVEEWLQPIIGKIGEAFRQVPEVKDAINTQRELLDENLQERGQSMRLPPLK